MGRVLGHRSRRPLSPRLGGDGRSDRLDKLGGRVGINDWPDWQEVHLHAPTHEVAEAGENPFAVERLGRSLGRPGGLGSFAPLRAKTLSPLGGVIVHHVRLPVISLAARITTATPIPARSSSSFWIAPTRIQ